MPVGIFPVGVFPAPLGSSGVTSVCSVVAAAVVSASVQELPALRDQPGGPNAPPIPPRFLRHSDEQTVVGLAAVFRAMEHPALRGACYSGWGVVAAPVFPGRLGSSDMFTKYRANGAAVVSPHSIPQYSLHSVSSAVSICLGVRGPNFGIGGGRQALAEGLTVAMSLMEQSTLPGLWLVLTQWSPEPVPDGFGSTCTQTTCFGTAIAIAPGHRPGTTLRMTISTVRPAPTPPPGNVAVDEDACASGWSSRGQAAYLELTRVLAADPHGTALTPWSLDLPWGGRVELIQAQHQQQAKAA
jgi:hypothetical protein